MSGAPSRQADGDEIRAYYEELDSEAGAVVRIADRENDDAWIVSDRSVPVEA